MIKKHLVSFGPNKIGPNLLLIKLITNILSQIIGK